MCIGFEGQDYKFSLVVFVELDLPLTLEMLIRQTGI